MLDSKGADSSTKKKSSYLAICLQPPSQGLCFSLLKLMLCLTFHIEIVEGSLNTWQGVLSPTRGCYHLAISGLCDISKSRVPQVCALAQTFMKVEQPATDVDVFVDPEAQH